MKKSVYFDTTIPSYYFDERESLKYPCEITRKLKRRGTGEFLGRYHEIKMGGLKSNEI